MTSLVRGYWCAFMLLLAPVASEEDFAHVSCERYDWIKREYESSSFHAAERKLWREWEGTNNALADLLNKSDANDRKCLMLIERLKDMRSTSAVLSLIKQITLPGIFMSLGDPLSAMYPAAGALVEIGQPAVREILTSRARAAATEHELRLFAAVVYHHYALEPEVGRCHIELILKRAQEELESQGQPKARSSSTWHQNLARILEFYKAAERRELRLTPPFEAEHNQSQRKAQE